MATATGKIGPKDHGRPMTLDEFLSADRTEGCRYELIDGELYVSPEADLPEAQDNLWIFTRLLLYARDFPDVINCVHPRARVFVPRRKRVTCPQPDVAAYHDFPVHLPIRKLRWQDVSPILVVEVLSSADPDKDLVRNVQLYWQVPTIKEYWVLDVRDDPDRPTLTVYRRRSKRWPVMHHSFGETYTTPLLPGFELIVDPRK
jgi:Uma2 family endonuclease